MSALTTPVVLHLRALIAPLLDTLDDARSIEQFALSFGWDVELSASHARLIQDAFGLDVLFAAVEDVSELVEAYDAVDPSDLKALATTAKAVIVAVNDLRTVAADPLPSPLDRSPFWEQLADELFDRLVYVYLAERAPQLLAPLLLTGVVERTREIPVGDGRVPYQRTTVHWDRLGPALRNPPEAIAERYGWGGDFDHGALLDDLGQALLLNGVYAELGLPSAVRAVEYYQPAELEAAGVLELRVPLYSEFAREGTLFEAGLALLPIKNAGNDRPTGLAITPILNVEGSLEIAMGPGLDLFLSGAFASGTVRLEVHPGEVDLEADPGVSISSHVEFRFQPDDPIVLLGEVGGSGVRALSGGLALDLRGSISDPEVVVTAGAYAPDPAMVVSILPGEGDSFLSSVLGSEPIEAKFSFALVWSSKRGFSINGEGGIEVTIPLNKRVSAVELRSITAGLQASSQSMGVSVGASGSLSLGPLVVSVDHVGVEIVFVPRKAGLLGKHDLRVGFKPPSGVGLAIDAGVVVGGGYLFFDRDRAEYAGVLQLEIGEIAVGAVGLLTTRMPDGSDGFSLLLIITAEFAPIQLGFGFTLNGLGGLLGVNRTVVVDVLREGLRARTLDSVMFPEDPVRNAPQIVSDLRRVFPPAPDQYVLGPMAILGWGTPPLLRAELGVVLELPSPLRLVVMGQLAAAFPSFEVDPKLVNLKMDVLGVLDFGRKEASLDAALYDSRVSVYALEGEMAMRMRWGGDPSFALAVGGMHPRFQPPPGFPSLKRVSVALGKGNNPRLRLEGYLALTSNSIQVGARLDLYAKAGRASVRGELSFDALFEFDPFRFEVAIRARVTVKAFGASVGVGLRLTLSGPTPWRAKGRVSIEICWVDVSVGFNVTIGPGRQPALPPPADVWTLLATALADARAWSAELPGQGQRLATLREVPGDGALAVHPLGTLAVRQRVVPLDTALETYGGAPVGSGRRFTVSAYQIGGSAFQPVERHLDDYFAPSQFFEMSDEEKVAAPSFEEMPAGFGGVGADQLATAWSTTVGPHPHTEKRYRLVTEVVDEDRLPDSPAASGTTRTPDYDQGEAGFHAAAAFGAAAHDPLRQTGRTRFEGLPLGLTLDDTAYAVADAQTLQRVAPSALPEGSVLRDRLLRRTARTYAGARAALRAHVREAPQDRDRYLVLAGHELDE